MAIVQGEHGGDCGGEGFQLFERRTRLRNRDLARARSAQMLTHRLGGWTPREIAAYFKVSPRHVNREIRAIPDREKRRIAREFQRGEISVGRPASG